MSCDIITIYNPFMSYMKDIDKSIKIFILPYFEGQYYYTQLQQLHTLSLNPGNASADQSNICH